MCNSRPKRRWEDNIRIDFNEIGFNTRNWVNSAQDRDWRALVNAGWNLQVPYAIELVYMKLSTDELIYFYDLFFHHSIVALLSCRPFVVDTF